MVLHRILIIMLIALAVWGVVIAALLISGRRWMAIAAAKVLPDLVRLLRGLARDSRVPRGSKWLLGFAALWVISPIDLIPEFIPVAGPLDDIVVVALVLRHVLKKAGRTVAQEHWTGDPAILERILQLSGVD
ncbi:MAG: hypothetical protein QOG88_488 [Actinomycetota bacterium]|jgi:uncharacterized membrane protein YkvA (DUF1232 family)|nr:hypothetical protein [Actinomycetota bacterium]